MKKKISTKTIGKVKNCGGVIVRLKKNGLLDVNVDNDTYLSTDKNFRLHTLGFSVFGLST